VAGKTKISARRAQPPPTPRRGPDWSVLVAAVFLAAGLGLEVATARSKRLNAAARDAVPLISPPRTWTQIGKAAVGAFSHDQIAGVAAGVGFYSVLALFPGLAAFVSFYGLFGDVGAARQGLSLFNGLAPQETLSFLGDEMVRIAAVHHAQLSLTFAFGLIVSLWSAKAAVDALIVGLNAAYEDRETRRFVALNLTSLGLTVGAIVLALVSCAAMAIGPEAIAALGYQPVSGLAVLRWPLLVVFVLGVLAILYRFGPSRPPARWRWVTPGSLFAALAWVLLSAGFSTYVGLFGHYDRTYGPLAAMIGLMMWLWLSVIVVLFGAELNNEAERAPVSAR